jgi:hypothetical protein
MEFKNTEHDMMVDYKLKGKLYNANPGTIEVKRKENPRLLISADPFDSELVLKGRTFALPDDVEWHRERVLST